MPWTRWLNPVDRQVLTLRNIVSFFSSIPSDESFCSSSLGLFWSLLRASDQGQCGCGLRGLGRDAGQRVPLGHWVKHPQRTDKAPHHSPDSGQHHHRCEWFVGVGGAAGGRCSPQVPASLSPWESHFTFYVLWGWPKIIILCGKYFNFSVVPGGRALSM